jgi:hypothetical protein
MKAQRMRWAAYVACTGITNLYKILVGKSEKKRPLGRSQV